MNWLLIAAVLAASFPAAATDRAARALRKAQGYTVVSVTSVDGDFEGCDYGRVIKLSDGTALTCSSYGYTYSYSPDAIVLGKTLSFQGKRFLSIKLLVDDELFDMEPALLK